MSERFEVLKKLGEGGMGVVYLCRDTVLERKVAIKVLKGATERQRARFLREAQALASLLHSGVVRVFDFAEHRGDPCLVLEYLPGKSLLELVNEHGPLPARRAAKVMAQIAATVAHVHEHGILHRDLKPENVLMHEGRPVLLDFGLCKYAGGDTRMLTIKDMGVGSPGYMAPEQINDAHNADTLSDVFGLGATLYALLTGCAPFRGEREFDVLLATLKEAPLLPSSLRPAIDPSLDVICSRCLEKDPQRRYPSADALVADLEAFLRGERILAQPNEVSLTESLPPTQAFARLMEIGFDSDDEVGAPQTPSQHGHVADGHVDAGDFEAAIEAYQRALAGRDDPAVRLKLGYALRRAGKAERAIEEYGLVLTAWPDDYRVHVGRGAARASLEDYAGAAVDFRRALKVLPKGHETRKQIKAALRAASKKVSETVIRRVKLVNPFADRPPTKD